MASSFPQLSPAFVEPNVDDASGLADVTDDLYDDGTDIIDIPVLPKSKGSVPAPPLPSSLRPRQDSNVSDTLPEATELEEIEPEGEQLESEGEEFEPEELEPEAVELEPEPDDYADLDDELEVEDERQSLLSEELEAYDPTAPDAGVASRASDPGEFVLKERGEASNVTSAEHDESEEEPTNKLKVEALAREQARAADSLADEAAPSLTPQPGSSGGVSPSSADELAPKQVFRTRTLKQLVDAASEQAKTPARSSRPTASSAPPQQPSSRAASASPASASPASASPASARPSAGSSTRPPTRAPVSISPRAPGVGVRSVAPGRAGSSARAPQGSEPSATPTSVKQSQQTSPARRTFPPATERASRPGMGRKSSKAPATPALAASMLENVRGLEDLPEEAHQTLAKAANVDTLSVDEELHGFAVALVLEGRVKIMPAIADVACAEAGKGEVVFTQGHLPEGVQLRVVASAAATRLAYWDSATLRAQIANCPWVDDDLRSIADRFQALAGAVMGSLGERLDENLRTMVTSRCEVVVLARGETLLEAGATVNGMYVLGAGYLELCDGEVVGSKLYPGDFLFPAQVMGGGGAPCRVRAGRAGALLLRADRMAAHELLVSVPPLIEILAG